MGFYRGEIFGSFFKQREIDATYNTSDFIFFETLLNYFVTIGLSKSIPSQLVKRYEETKENDWLLQ